MRIDSKTSITPISVEQRETPSRGAPTKAAAEGAAVVSVSEHGARAREVSATREHEMSARLESIKKMIDAGTYPIDLDKLASRIADDEMLRSRRSS